MIPHSIGASFKLESRVLSCCARYTQLHLSVVGSACCFVFSRDASDEVPRGAVCRGAVVRLGSGRSGLFGAAAVPLLRARGGGGRGPEVRSQPPGAVAPELHGDRREARLRSALRESAGLPVRSRDF